MNLVQLLVPLRDNNGTPYPDSVNRDLNGALAEKFGGVTAYARAPAKGVWMHHGEQERDDVVVVEVMTDSLDRSWWAGLRAGLEKKLGQRELVVRTWAMERL